MLNLFKKWITAAVVLSLCFTICACSPKEEESQKDADKGDVTMIDFSDLSKLTFTCLGDSLTAGQGIETPYSTFVKDELGFKAVNNYGIGWSTVANSGSCVCHPNNFDNAHNPFTSRYSFMEKGDVIAVCGGVNDHGINVPLGTIDDDTSETFYGAMNRLIAGLKELNPGAYIFFMTPFNYDTTNDVGLHLSVYVDAIKEVCIKHNIDCYDCYTEIPINVSVDTIDGVHPTQEFVEKIWAPQIAQFIRNNIG